MNGIGVRPNIGQFFLKALVVAIEIKGFIGRQRTAAILKEAKKNSVPALAP